MWACSWAASRRGCWVLASRTGWPSTTTTRPRSMLTHKIVSPDEAVAVIRDGDTVCTSGFVGIGTPDELILALERRYLAARQPSGLTLVFAAAPGDGRERGLNRLAHAGLLKRVVGGHWSLVPKIGELALDNAIEAYNLPLGCISRLYREIAARGPGLLSKVGLRTFVDPRQGGGKLNAVTTEDLVELMEIEGETWLRYKASDPRGADPGHHRRSGRQHHDGAGGADAGQPRDRDGGQELAGARHRASRAHRGSRVLDPRGGADPRRL